MKHVAYNLVTHEVLFSNHSNALKRRVAQIEHWNIANGYGKGKWIFAHGKQCEYKIAAKLP